MTLQQLRRLGRELATFLGLFRACFRTQPGFALGCVYIRGLLSDVSRKNIEAMALEFATSPRTLQRFVESIKWDEDRVRDECQRLVAREHAHAEAIGCVDESGTAKSGGATVGASRQWLGSEGKVENGVVGVHLSYVAPGFQCLLDSQLYLSKEWANDPARRKKTTFPRMWSFTPSQRSLCNSSTVRWPMACRSSPGHLTKPTVATEHSWMLWRNDSRYSWPRYRRTSTLGCKSLGSCEADRRAAEVGRGNIRVWRVGDHRARCKTCFGTPPRFENNVGSVIASRTRNAVPKSGK